MKIRTQVKAGKLAANHGETLRVPNAIGAAGPVGAKGIAMRQQPRETANKEDRLALLVVRAGLRAGARRRRRY